MILVLDVGNTQIHGGVFVENELRLQFRTGTKEGITSDDLGVFLRSVLRENHFELGQLQKIAICSVVPDLTHSIRNCVLKYFQMEPFFLQAGVKTGLKIKYRNPLEVGADRIANAIAATHLYPKKDIVVIDFGTATTLCAISHKKEYLGGIILPGLRIAMEMLDLKTAKLPKVQILKPKELIGRSTEESIQSGLYHGYLAIATELTKNIKSDYFANNKAMVIGTGGLARLYEKEQVFDDFVPTLALQGLKIALSLNN
ncbi:type III pantothenate kinase [Candidatus Uabimicrobium sp. HlEnr_7]|uniref:type III pantothenate kinase n=1 Tax=Candidatus Uabimicrobium helgolandensis TaxID=3095367 RepID=UPI003556C17F